MADKSKKTTGASTDTTATKVSSKKTGRGSDKGAAAQPVFQKIQPTTALESLSAVVFKQDLPVFRPGDRVIVKSRIKEGDKERIQAFEGIVINRKGRGIRESFTVRRVTAGVGIERVFPVHSPMIAEVEVKVQGFVRRAKLNYIRDLDGKAARIQDRNLKLQSAHAASQGETV
jgi:large subunit ribosomal protein L19